MGGKHLGDAARIRRSSAQHAIQRDPERVDVAASVEFKTAGLFRTHVLGRARHLARIGGALGDPQRQTEVRDHRHALAVQHDIVGLDVQVDDPAFVRVGKPDGDLLDDAHRLVHPQVPEAVQLLGDAPAVDVLHDDVVVVLMPADGVDADDIRMFHPGCGPGLLDELAHVRLTAIGEPLLQELDGHGPLQAKIFAVVHNPPAALSELLGYLAALDRLSDQRILKRLFLALVEQDAKAGDVVAVKRAEFRLAGKTVLLLVCAALWLVQHVLARTLGAGEHLPALLGQKLRGRLAVNQTCLDSQFGRAGTLAPSAPRLDLGQNRLDLGAGVFSPSR